ncbi:unnamed protein product [Ciceribacter selenitireducens ATCC BAA-1503]|uniref:Uncharacterized protein n=1 Tax=Ciceribacter selenitireducens ATCC BAA-1503 TaxID=1336235 RepID=A0A376AAU6_9HYPH|nr:unnamed protein product [Ciceribacter selenitireducens ATCC BAA-1503]
MFRCRSHEILRKTKTGANVPDRWLSSNIFKKTGRGRDCAAIACLTLVFQNIPEDETTSFRPGIVRLTYGSKIARCEAPRAIYSRLIQTLRQQRRAA